ENDALYVNEIAAIGRTRRSGEPPRTALSALAGRELDAELLPKERAPAFGDRDRAVCLPALDPAELEEACCECGADPTCDVQFPLAPIETPANDRAPLSLEALELDPERFQARDERAEVLACGRRCDPRPRRELTCRKRPVLDHGLDERSSRRLRQEGCCRSDVHVALHSKSSG